MEKIDLYKEHKDEYVKPKQPAVIQVKAAKYLTAEGRGKPGSEPFQAQIGALYGVAFTIAMTRKPAGKQQFKVCGLEGLYWPDDPGRCIAEEGTGNFNWKLMIRVPPSVSEKELTEAVAKIQARGKEGPFGDVKLEVLKEGKCVQVLHTGPYEAVGETINRMYAFCGEKGLEAAGRHHEIYLNDPNRTAPERLKTLIRQPVAAARKQKAAGV